MLAAQFDDIRLTVSLRIGKDYLYASREDMYMNMWLRGAGCNLLPAEAFRPYSGPLRAQTCSNRSWLSMVLPGAELAWTVTPELAQLAWKESKFE